MPRFRYVALSVDGRQKQGEIDAAHEQAVASTLKAQGLWIVSIQSSSGTRTRHSARNDVKERDMALLAKELSALLTAGAPVDRALALLQELAPSKSAKTLIIRTLERVRRGEALSAALEASGLDPGGGRIGLLRAGEAAGETAEALARIAAAMEKAEALKNAIQGALLYPAMVAAAALGAIVLMVVAVLPRFQAIFASAGGRLPGAAGALLDASLWLQAYWLEVALSGFAVIALTLLWRRTETGALAFSRLSLAAPVIGQIFLRLDAASFCRTFSLSLSGGAPALEAANHATEAMGRLALRRAASTISRHLGEGRGLAESMSAAGFFPPVAIGLARVGEESGAAPAMLSHAAELLEARAERDARRAVQLIAPAATLLLGGLVALIVVSMMTAMLSLNSVI